MPNLLIQPAPMPSWGLAQQRAAQIKGAQTQNILAEQRLQDYPEERKWLAEERGRQRTTWSREDEAYKRGVERLKFKDEADALDYMIKSSPMINWQNYPQSRQHLLDMGLNPATLPEPEAIYNQAMEAGVDPNQFFESWKNKALITGQQRLELIKTQADKISETGKTRTIQKGDEEITEQWTGLAWEEVGRGPKWAPKETTEPTGMRDFELTTYGKERPDLRGSKEYIAKRLEWIKSQKEQSPYVDALNRQIEVTAKREGTNLRKEFYNQIEVKEANDIKRKYEVMNEAFKESKTTKNFVAVDQAIITLFNKMTDPQSVVRESEYARTASDLALWHRVKGKVSKWISGGAGLSQDDREAVLKMAGKFQEVAQRKYKARLHEYKGYLSNYGLDPDKYLTPYGIEEGTAESGTPRTAEEYLKKFGGK